jgi:inosose dehydratase
VDRLTRRDCLRAAALAVTGLAARAAPAAMGCTLSTGTYGFKGTKLEDALRTIADTGFDGVEIAAQPGYDGDPAALPADRRAAVRRLLADRKLRLTALMEHLTPNADAGKHAADLDRLRRVFELARDLRPDAPPLVQTVLGGGTWEEKRALFRDRVGDWAKAAAAAGVVLAVKPHRGGALSTPAEAAWLITQIGGDRPLKMVFDYSHYAFRDITPEDAVKAALPHVAHVAAKDAVKAGDKVTFALPGEAGTVDHAKLLRLLYDGGYRGDVCCEVSSQVSAKPGYDPAAAAKVCYRNVARAFEQARVPREKGQP